MRRIVAVFDVPVTSEAEFYVFGPNSLLERIRRGIRFGVGDTLQLGRPVEVVECLVTGPEVESIVILNKQAPGAYLLLSGPDPMR